MNIRDLKYLVAIADHNHFGKAAEASFISQPALSMQIKKLEMTLGVQLIERTNKTVLLTEIGKTITELARDILYRVNSMKETAKLASDPCSCELHLGVIPTLGPYLLPYIIPSLTKIFPKLKIYLVEAQTENLKLRLKQGKLDAALFGLPLLDNDFEALPLFEEEVLLALPKTHVLSKRKTVRPSDLANQELMLLEDGHCLREMVLKLCEDASISANQHFQATSLETLRHMVASNVGITLMPKLSAGQNDDICFLPFHSPKLTRTVGMIWRCSSAKKILIQLFVTEIRKILLRQKLVKVINTSLLCSTK